MAYPASFAMFGYLLLRSGIKNHEEFKTQKYYRTNPQKSSPKTINTPSRRIFMRLKQAVCYTSRLMTEKPENDVKLKHLRFALVALWVVAFGWMYHSVAWASIGNFLDPANDMTYGFLVLPMAVCMAFTMRKKLRLVAGRPALGGLVLLLLSFALHGFVQHSGQLFFNQLAMILSIPAVVWTCWGRSAARLLLFPTAYLLLIIPLHLPLLNSESLSWLSGIISSGILNGFGVETLFLDGFNEDLMREGVFLYSPKGHFQFHVADICSGMRSLAAIIVFTAAYGFFIYKTGLRIFLLVASTIPLVILANIVRIVILCLIAIRFGQDATTPFIHETPGLVMFYATVVFMLWVGDRFISRIGKDPSNAPVTHPARQGGWTAGIMGIVLGIILTAGMVFLAQIQL